ncbi:MAG: hypothetical protein AB7P52_09605 [Alphaproteobacteria bacterium]
MDDAEAAPRGIVARSRALASAEMTAAAINALMLSLSKRELIEGNCILD